MAPRSSIDVFLRLHGQRKFSKEIAASGAELEAMGVKGARSIAQFAASGEKLKKFGKSWTHNVTLPVLALGAVSGKMAIDFHQAMSLIQTQAGASAKETKFLEGSVLKMAENSKFGPTELANALFRVRSAGFKAKEALDVLNQGKNLSTVGNSDLEMTTKALTGAAKTLGLTKAGQLHGLAAEMNSIVGTGDMRMEELQDALSTGVLPAFKNAGLGIRDYGSALTVMTDRNVPAQVASTRLRTAITMLIPHSTKAEEALEGIGIQSETLATIMRRQGLPATIEFLSKKLSGLSQNKQNRVMIEAFGGAKSSATIETLVQNASELPKKWDLIAKGVGKYNKEIRVAEKQPGTELAKAWSSIQVALIKIGDTLLPAVVPAFHKLAAVFTSVAHVFVGLPPNVQAAAAGFLILTGPVLSGLGYFAGGVGRILILTTKLARAGKSLSIFTTAMSAGQGLAGSAGMALEGGGIASAASYAKGFALSLGPAVAAYGVGNIATSALSGDWKDAGFEAGGAIAGGIAGSILGGPLGAMIGVGLGSYAGELASKLFGGSASASLVQKLAHGSKEASYWYGEQEKASKALAGAEHVLTSAHHRQDSAINGVKGAQAHLTAMVRKYGAGARPVIRAEGALAQKRWGVAKATQAIHDKERLRGYALSADKASTRWAIASGKEQIHLLKLRAERLGHLLHYEQFHGASRERLGILGKRVGNVIGALRGEEKKLADTAATSAKEIGPKWTHAMMTTNAVFLKFETNPFETRLDHLGKNPAPKKLSQGFKEAFSKQINPLMQHFNSLLETANHEAAELESRQLPSFSTPGLTIHPQHPNPLGPPSPPTAPRRNTAAVPRPSVKRVKAGSLNGVIQVAVENVNTLLLDGKEVAANTTRHSQKAANRA